ncbi:hypothetical protein [Thermococcus sp. Bubb.Bath]|uniref:hypothetical protein n=1 Tax=Thermococcus sp. Bubb.Bath TaxID=1638242 RepID=UPI0014393314|nr:hypothetical protein [Thermococcus sp. Bubb.Bath]NJF24601.1 hypothetical protein [Thermococcus sp. Bubb.Bath]
MGCGTGIPHPQRRALIERITELLKRMSFREYEKVAAFAASSYPIEPGEIELKSLTVDLRTAYIISWSAGEEKDRALVFSKDEVVLRASSDEKFAVPIKKGPPKWSSEDKSHGEEDRNTAHPRRSRSRPQSRRGQ